MVRLLHFVRIRAMTVSMTARMLIRALLEAREHGIAPRIVLTCHGD